MNRPNSAQRCAGARVEAGAELEQPTESRNASMKLQEDIDFTTLNWVKQELDETLNQARQALEAYVDDPGRHQPDALLRNLPAPGAGHLAHGRAVWRRRWSWTRWSASRKACSTAV
jgi:hypothetical protein